VALATRTGFRGGASGWRRGARAAIGITEQTDAVVVVCSEETGEIRVAREGRFSRPMTEETEVRKALNQLLAAEIYRGRTTRTRVVAQAEGGA